MIRALRADGMQEAAAEETAAQKTRWEGAQEESSGALLHRAKAPDDDEAWFRLVEKYGPLVFYFCRRQGLQEADARDVTQNVFVRVSRAMPGFDYDPAKGSFRSWLAVVTFREIRRHVERERRAPGAAAPNDGNAAVQQLQRGAEGAWQDVFHQYVYNAALQRVASSIDPDVWEAFQRTWVHEHSPQDVADQLGRSPQWVYKAKFRVLQRLRAEVKQLAEEAGVG